MLDRILMPHSDLREIAANIDIINVTQSLERHCLTMNWSLFEEKAANNLKAFSAS
jgi:hypothetical protein